MKPVFSLLATCALTALAGCAISSSVAPTAADKSVEKAASLTEQALAEAVTSADPQACIPASTFVELQADVAGTVADSEGKELVALGMYERVSPDGR